MAKSYCWNHNQSIRTKILADNKNSRTRLSKLWAVVPSDSRILFFPLFAHRSTHNRWTQSWGRKWRLSGMVLSYNTIERLCVYVSTETFLFLVTRKGLDPIASLASPQICSFSQRGTDWEDSPNRKRRERSVSQVNLVFPPIPLSLLQGHQIIQHNKS